MCSIKYIRIDYKQQFSINFSERCELFSVFWGIRPDPIHRLPLATTLSGSKTKTLLRPSLLYKSISKIIQIQHQVFGHILSKVTSDVESVSIIS